MMAKRLFGFSLLLLMMSGCETLGEALIEAMAQELNEPAPVAHGNFEKPPAPEVSKVSKVGPREGTIRRMSRAPRARNQFEFALDGRGRPVTVRVTSRTAISSECRDSISFREFARHAREANGEKARVWGTVKDNGGRTTIIASRLYIFD